MRINRLRPLLLASAPRLAPPAHAQVAQAEVVAAEIRQHLEAAAVRLDLTDDQKPKMRALLEREADELRRAKFESVRALRAMQREVRGQLVRILTPVQLGEWDRFRDETVARLRASPAPR